MSQTYQIHEGTFQTHDSLNLFYRFCRKEKADRTMLILHGHGEHIDRYLKFMPHLASEDLHLAWVEFRGHGRSEGEEVYVESFEDLIEDVSRFVGFIQNKFSVGKRVLLLGHSNGGLVATHWAYRYPEMLQGLILSSPCLGLSLPKPAIWLNQTLNAIVPHFIYESPVYPPHLTHNAEEVQNYKRDPLIRRKISVRLLHEMLAYGNKVDEIKPARTPFPLFILAAGMEKVVDLGKTKRFFERVQTPIKEMRIFDGFYHEIFNELGQETVFECLKKYLHLC